MTPVGVGGPSGRIDIGTGTALSSLFGAVAAVLNAL